MCFIHEVLVNFTCDSDVWYDYDLNEKLYGERSFSILLIDTI